MIHSNIERPGHARKELAPRLRRSRVVPFTSFHALGISITNGRYASNFKKLKL